METNSGQWIVVILILSHRGVACDSGQWEGFIVSAWPMRGLCCDTGPPLTGITWRMKSPDTGHWPPNRERERVPHQMRKTYLLFCTEIRYFTKLASPRSQKFINPPLCTSSHPSCPRLRQPSLKVSEPESEEGGMWGCDQFQFVSTLRDEWSAEIIWIQISPSHYQHYQASDWSPAPTPGVLIGHHQGDQFTASSLDTQESPK